MRLLSLTLALLLATALPAAHAQESEAEVETVILQQSVAQATTAVPFTAGEAFDAIQEFGLSGVEAQALDGFSLGAQGNLALLRQTGHGASLGVSNTAAIDQSGDGNLAVVLQEGDFNYASALQVGERNVVGVRLRGVGNRLGTSEADPGVRQAGAGNVYLLDFTGDNQVIAPTTQVGDGNQVVQLGGVAAPFGVEQYGDGMRMIIRHNGGR